MKKLALILSSLALSGIAFADPQFTDITQKDVDNVSAEFGANFSHTVVAAPETDGLWGLEVGLGGGMTGSPDFKKVVNDSGGDGDDFKNIYHAGLMARAHFPFDLFVEASYLPSQEISNVDINNKSFGLGWNAGAFLGLPLDVAVGAGLANGEIKFTQAQDVSSSTVAADIKLKTSSKIYWVGISKSFLFFTPYAKVGISHIEGDLDATASIFDQAGVTSKSASVSGNYLTVGANIQLLILKIGAEATQIQGVKRVSAKVSIDF